jgi:acyl-coenzyme A thioesterase PaaI-like protein
VTALPPTAPAPSALRPLLESERSDPSFGQNCIGCSPRNAKGLHLCFEPHGRQVRAQLVLDRSYESYPGMIHGGIIALILDEVTGRAALWHARTFVVTQGIRLRYAAVMQPGVRYVASAEVDAEPAGELLRVSGAIEEVATGRLIATATSSFMAPRGERLAELVAALPEATRALALALEHGTLAALAAPTAEGACAHHVHPHPAPPAETP